MMINKNKIFYIKGMMMIIACIVILSIVIIIFLS